MNCRLAVFYKEKADIIAKTSAVFSPNLQIKCTFRSNNDIINTIRLFALLLIR